MKPEKKYTDFNVDLDVFTLLLFNILIILITSFYFSNKSNELKTQEQIYNLKKYLNKRYEQIKEITELKQSQLDSFKSMSEAFKNIGYDKQK